MREAKTIEAALPELKRKLEMFPEPPVTHPALKEAPRVTEKVHTLLQVVKGASGKGMVFVDRVILTYPLADLIERRTGRAAQGVYGAMPRSEKDEALERLRTGEVDVLVATDTMLEGINVPDCEWIVRFSRFNTTKSHIQGSGRARSQTAQVFYFENDPRAEEQAANSMCEVARDSDAAASEELRALDLRESARRAQAGEGVHPWVADGFPPITFENGLEIVDRWCQRVLQGNYDRDALWVQEGDEPAWQIQGPDGPLLFTKADVDDHWGSVQLADVLPPEVLQPLGGKKKELRRTFYVIAIELQKRGFLDKANEPLATYVKMAKLQAPAIQRSASLVIRDTFPRSSSSRNPITELQEYADKNKIELTYKWTTVSEGFVAEVFVAGRRYSGVPAPSKQAAKSSAAQKALEGLRSTGG